MPYDSFTVCAVTNELNKTLRGGKISKIYQPEKDEAVFLVYSGKNYRLLLSCGAVYPRIHLTDTVKENPETPYAFCMVLRKYLTGGTIVSFEQLPYDRVVTINIENSSEMYDTVKYKLIAEIMGRQSNLILCGEDNKILASLKTVSLDSASRTMLAGMEYVYPQNDKICLNDKTSVLKVCNDFAYGTAELVASAFKGFSLDSAEYVTSNAEEGRLAPALFAFDEKIKSGKYKPCILLSGDIPANHFVFPYGNEDGLVFYDTVNSCVDAFYSGKDKGKRINDKKREIKTVLRAAIKKAEKKSALLLEKLEECRQAEDFKKYGELITAYIYTIKNNPKWVILSDYYNDNKDIKIDLDENLSPSQNAQRYFKKYAKLKNANEQASSQLKQTREQLEYLLSVETYLNAADSGEVLDGIKEELCLADIIRNKSRATPKKRESTPYILKKEIDGCIIYCGKNNIQNDYITFKLAKPDDLWLHVKNAHGPHVIIKSCGKISDIALTEAAKLAADFGDKNDRANVDYTYKKYVKKPSGAKAGFVIYTDYKTITVRL